MNRILKNIITLSLIIIIVSCIIIVIDKNYEYYKSNNTYKELREKVFRNLADSNEERNEKFKEINSDYKFWISIDNTEIDYPVVQGRNNEFYLQNNFYKEKDICGSIFIDCNNDILNDKNLILYGHNMRNGSMFAGLNKFKEKNYFDTGIIKIIKDDKEYSYEIFSVFTEASDKLILKSNFDYEEQFLSYIDYMKQKSIYGKNISNNISSIITLYTCSYEFDEARTIVCAALIEK